MDDFFKNLPGETLILADDPRPFFKEQGKGKCVCFTGNKGVEVNGAWSDFSSVLPQAERFSGIEAEPCTDTVLRMTEFLERTKPDTVFAIGGGSVLDAAKAAYLVYQTGAELSALFGSDRWSSEHKAHLRRIVAVPTTSGTGSEATPYSNIVDRTLEVKKLIKEEEIIPEHACLVPRYTSTMARHVTLATGCDALAHLMEGFLNTGADNRHPLANNWAKRGIELVVENLEAALLGNAEARRNMAIASALGGMTIRYKSTGLPHLCSFSWFGRIEHGIAAIMLLPESWRYYLGNPAVAERTMELKGIFPGETPEEIIVSCRKFLTKLGVPEKLNEFPDLSWELMEKTARSAGENKMKLELAPRPVPVAQSCEILTQILKQTYGD